MKLELGKKTQFALLITLVIIPAVLVFPFVVTIFLMPSVHVSGTNPIIPSKEMFYFWLMMGVGIQTYCISFGIKNLYKMIRIVRINELG